jgi:hypothetical protein
MIHFSQPLHLRSTLKATCMKNNLRALASLALAACVAGQAFAAGGHDHTPKNGGVVVETKAGDLEIVAKSDLLQIFISDHGKPVTLIGAKAKVTLLNGTEKSEVELLPAGNKMEVTGNFKVSKGTKGIAVLTLSGKPPTTARFEVK